MPNVYQHCKVLHQVGDSYSDKMQRIVIRLGFDCLDGPINDGIRSWMPAAVRKFDHVAC